MKDTERLWELEQRIIELEQQLEHLEEFHSNHLDENDVRVVVDKIFMEKKIASQEEIDSKIVKSHLQLVKWIIATGISIGAVIISMIRFF
ncbi:MAG TPA: hypothetical protein VEY70_23355 [Metabacillus sp.]|nr:hypothetical protein [Metabacillus sp.]